MASQAAATQGSSQKSWLADQEVGTEVRRHQFGFRSRDSLPTP